MSKDPNEVLISILYISSMQHIEESVRVLRWFSIAIFHPERVSTSDRKQFAPVLYLILRSIGLSHL